MSDDVLRGPDGTEQMERYRSASYGNPMLDREVERQTVRVSGPEFDKLMAQWMGLSDETRERLRNPEGRER